MAEFAEVMRQWERVRKATANSAEENVLSVYPLEEYDDALIADIEKNVMQWAAEHPEPVYPSYLEVFGWGHKKTWAEIKDILANPIPADLAKKLNVEPKEGT